MYHTINDNDISNIWSSDSEQTEQSISCTGVIHKMFNVCTLVEIQSKTTHNVKKLTPVV